MSLARMLNELKLGNGFKQKNRNGLKILDIGDTVPTDATAGYEIGAIFLHTDGSGGTVMYHNEGTAGSCDFNAASGITATQEASLDNNTTRVNSLEGTATVLTNATHVIEVATSDVATTGTVRAAEIDHTVGVTDLSTIREALYVNIGSAYTTGDWTNAIVGRIEYTGGTGKADGGMAAAICAEMNMPAAAQTGGAYYSLDLEMNCPTSFVHADNDALPVSFLKFGLWGGAKGEFDDHGVLFHIDGLSDGGTHCFDTTASLNNAQIDASLKINVNGTIYYIPLMDNANGS